MPITIVKKIILITLLSFCFTSQSKEGALLSASTNEDSTTTESTGTVDSNPANKKPKKDSHTEALNKIDANFKEEQKAIQIKHQRAQDDANKKIDSQKKVLQTTAVIETAFAGAMFAAAHSTQNPAFYVMGAMSAMQAVTNIVKKGELQRTRVALSQGQAAPPTFSDPCSDSSCTNAYGQLEGLGLDDLDEINPDINSLAGSLIGNICKDPKLKCPSDLKVTEDKDGAYKVTIGKKEFDPDSLTDEQSKKIGSLAKKFSNNFNTKNPLLASQLKEAEEDLEEEAKKIAHSSQDSFESSSSNKASSSFAGNSSSSDSSEARAKRRAKRKLALQNQINGLLNQFKTNPQASAIKGKSVTVGNSQVGVIQDNIFLMVHRRYQERRSKNQFIEKLKRLPSAFTKQKI